MVFCGKPSGGCHACRARKTKCDKIPEGCTQCLRAKRGCPGYRSQGDLIFRDESTNVVRKFKAREARKQAALELSLPVSVPAEEDRSLEIVRQQDPHLSSFQLAPLSMIWQRVSLFRTMSSKIPIQPEGIWTQLKLCLDLDTSMRVCFHA